MLGGAAAGLLLGACGSSDLLGGSDAVPPEARALKAETALPPGQSGFWNTVGQAQGLLTGNPGDFGAHVDDQRLMYWNFDAKPGVLGTKPGTPETPKDNVEIYRDDYGVPIVHAPSVRDLWFGVGYAVAQDRLFLMDAVRRMGAGTFSELTGCGGVPGDIQQRTLSYTDAEYEQMFERLSPDARDAVLGYVDGANAWRQRALLNPLNLPVEYVLLTTLPAEFTVKDVLAAGVYITRFVASEGGNEFQNIRMLKALEGAYGSRAAALDAFQDLVWLDDSKAVATVPAGGRSFSNHPMPAGGREAVFRELAEWSMNLPETLWKGDGTGHAATPFPCDLTALPGPLGGGGGLGAGEVVQPKAGNQAEIKAGTGKAAIATREPRQVREAAARRAVREVQQALIEFRHHLHGGSFAMALAGSRTRDGGGLLISAPQLGYGYPLLLVEYEINGAGYAARGSSVPMLPVVGIGYSEHLAWGLTTGYSKTIDSYIETVCSTAQQSAGTCTRNQYFHNGAWKDMDCRSERVAYRAATQGIPAGPAILGVDAEICRTVHGPIVTRDEAAGLARSVQFAMFGREIETIETIREWNRAKTMDEFRAASLTATWNENVTVASRDGQIGYFHSGLHLRRHAQTDQRLPTPGDGSRDPSGLLAPAEVPQVLNPAQGYLANWNNKPAHGWLDGEGLGSTSRPGGAGQRVTNLLDKLATRSDWTYADLREIDRHAGIVDPRARQYLPVLRAFRASAGASLGEVQRAALDRVLAWDGSHYGPDIALDDEAARDGVEATIFGELVLALRDELFGALKTAVIDTDAELTVYSRLAGVGSHVFDQSVMDNLVVRVLDPSTSALTLRRDYSGGRQRDAVIAAALDVALQRLAAQYNGGTALTVATLDVARRVHPRSELCSLSGVVGPGSSTIPGTNCVTMPYQDRGSWVHRVGYERP
jgi:penicillin amidase